MHNEPIRGIYPANPGGGLSAFWLKIVAIVGMMLQHTALALPGAFPLGLEIFLQISGGVTMPIMAFLLVEGFYATSNLDKYMKRLAVFGGISFIPHLFAFGSGFNIMFTLLIGLLILRLRRDYGGTAKFWLLFVVLCFITLIMDWGLIGPASVLLYDMIKNDRMRRIVVPIFFAVGVVAHSALISVLLSPIVDMAALMEEKSIAGSFFPLGSLLVIPLLLAYKGERGRPAKMFFYGFYPAHLAVLAVISLILGRNVLVNMIRDFMYEFVILL